MRNAECRSKYSSIRAVTRIRDRAGEYFGSGRLHCEHVTSIVKPACDRVKQLRDDQCHDHIAIIRLTLIFAQLRILFIILNANSFFLIFLIVLGH